MACYTLSTWVKYVKKESTYVYHLFVNHVFVLGVSSLAKFGEA